MALLLSLKSIPTSSISFGLSMLRTDDEKSPTPPPMYSPSRFRPERSSSLWASAGPAVNASSTPATVIALYIAYLLVVWKLGKKASSVPLSTKVCGENFSECHGTSARRAAELAPRYTSSGQPLAAEELPRLGRRIDLVARPRVHEPVDANEPNLGGAALV